MFLAIVGGFTVTGTLCVVRDVVMFDQVVCVPWKSAFGKVIVSMSGGTLGSGYGYSFEGFPKADKNVTCNYNEEDVVIKQGRFYHTSLYFQAGSGISISGHVIDSTPPKNSSQQTASGIKRATANLDTDNDNDAEDYENASSTSSSSSSTGQFDSHSSQSASSSSSSSSSSHEEPCKFTYRVYFMNLDSFVNFRNGRGFTPLGSNYSGCGAHFSATLDSVDVYGEYYVVIHYPQDEYLQSVRGGRSISSNPIVVARKKKTETQRSINATFTITARRAIIDTSKSTGSCSSTTCSLTASKNSVFIVQGHTAEDLENTTDVPLDPVMHAHVKSLLKGSYRATIFITIGFISLVFIFISLFIPWWRGERNKRKALAEAAAAGVSGLPGANGTSPSSSLLPPPGSSVGFNAAAAAAGAGGVSSGGGYRQMRQGTASGAPYTGQQQQQQRGGVYEIKPSPPPSPPPPEDDFPSLDLSSTPPPQPLLDMIDAEYMMEEEVAGRRGGSGGGGGGSLSNSGMYRSRVIPMKDLRQSQSQSQSRSQSRSMGYGSYDGDSYREDGSDSSSNSSSGAGSYTDNNGPRNYHYKVVKTSVTTTDSPLVAATKRKSRMTKKI